MGLMFPLLLRPLQSWQKCTGMRTQSHGAAQTLTLAQWVVEEVSAEQGRIWLSQYWTCHLEDAQAPGTLRAHYLCPWFQMEFITQGYLSMLKTWP